MKDFFLIIGLLLSVYVLLMVIRVVFSHNAPERIVALDTINTLIITLMILMGAMEREALYIDIGIVYGVISFIGTLFISRYLIREEK
ncbi:MAG: cation:proton antiporter [bacterium]|nr:cation:proton antiporter [bacterium]